jgi:hypothetical protein
MPRWLKSILRLALFSPRWMQHANNVRSHPSGHHRFGRFQPQLFPSEKYTLPFSFGAEFVLQRHRGTSLHQTLRVRRQNPSQSFTHKVINAYGLTQAVMQELAQARQEAMKANSDLTKSSDLLRQKMRDFQRRPDQAILQAAPNVAPVVTTIERDRECRCRCIHLCRLVRPRVLFPRSLTETIVEQAVRRDVHVIHVQSPYL